MFQKANVGKIMVNIQKMLKGVSMEADFWHGENIDPAEKKAPNREFYWGPFNFMVKLDF